jgi:curved DNA-binding protein CbpA
MVTGDKHHDIDYYALLGVSHGSSIQEIKSAFRKLSMKTHPDRGGSNEAQARINFAYKILSDPILRRRYDETRPTGRAPAHEKPRYRSKRAEEWERSFRKTRVKKNIKERVREEIKKRSEEIGSGYGARVDALFTDACRAFTRTRGRFIVFASAALIFLAAGLAYPVLWAGVLVSGFAATRNSRYGNDDDTVFVLHPEWRYVLKKHAKKRVRRENDARRARLDEISDYVIRLLSDVRKSSGAKDDEQSVLRRMLIHFFLLGYAPVSHDENARIVTLRGGDDTIALRYRHRSGGPVNAAFVKKLHEYMSANGIQKGFLFAATGLSKNAAVFADDHAIAHYTIREMNAWIGRTALSDYPGPWDDIIGRIDSFMKFIRRT